MYMVHALCDIQLTICSSTVSVMVPEISGSLFLINQPISGVNSIVIEVKINSIRLIYIMLRRFVVAAELTLGS